MQSQLEGDKTKTESLELSCPVGEPECAIISELARVREEMASLQTKVRTDELTGLFNYRHFVEGLDLEMERARRSGQSMSLIMLDLDHFKRVNDSWGHEFGNVVLARVSKLLLETVRRVDIACRFGGEELAVILPDTTLRSGVNLANRLCEKIRVLPFEFQGEAVQITASFGVDVYKPEEKDSASQFVRRVDSWLLIAKQEGRDRVCHAPFKKASSVSQDERDLLLKG